MPSEYRCCRTSAHARRNLIHLDIMSSLPGFTLRMLCSVDITSSPRNSTVDNVTRHFGCGYQHAVPVPNMDAKSKSPVKVAAENPDDRSQVADRL